MTTKTIKAVFLVVAGMMGFVAHAADVTQTVKSGDPVLVLPSDGTGHITVEAGGSVDIKNVGAGSAYTFTIAGEGVDGRGAIFCSEAAEGVTNTIAGLTLAGDATIKTDVAWGVRTSGDGTVAGSLMLNGFTLTKKGADSFVFNKVAVSGDAKESFTTSTGSFVVDMGSFLLGNGIPTEVLNILVQPGCTFIIKKYNVVAEEIQGNFSVEMRHNTTLHIPINWAYASARVPKFTFKPIQPEMSFLTSVNGTADISNFKNNSADYRPFVFDTSLLDPNALPLGGKFVVLTNLISTTSNQYKDFPATTLNDCSDSRYAVTVSAKFIEAEILRDPPNYYHYDFDGETLADA